MSISDFYTEVAELAGLDAASESALDMVAKACNEAAVDATAAEIASTVSHNVLAAMMAAVR